MHLYNYIWVVLLVPRLNLAFLSPKLSRVIDKVLVCLCPCGFDNPRNTLWWKLLQLSYVCLRIILLGLRTANSDQRALSPAWSETNPSIRRDSVTMQLRWIKVLHCLVRQAQALCHAATIIRTYHSWEKPLAQQTKHGFDLSHQRPRMLYELGTWCPQSWALGWEPLGEKSRLPEQAGKYDSHSRWLRMPESLILCRH
jgi:hypothetical protein